MKKLSGLLQWIDTHLLKILLVGYIYIIPLYPKLPLFNVNYTYVHVRLEDVYIGIISLFFLIQVLRRKIILNKKFVIYFGLFWVAVFTSFIVANFVLKSLAPQVMKVSLLHALRRVEYMIAFFIAYAAIKNRQDFYFYMKNVLVALALVCLYGVGQKLFGWCAVQTMNPEFAKGYCLKLSSDARISSTFAGHYDLAAYLTLLIPITLGLYTYLKKMRYFVPFVLAIMAMVLTASRASYGSYLLSTVPFLAFRRKFKLLIIAVALTAILTPLSGELTSRIKRTFIATQIYVDPVTGETYVPQESKILPPGTVKKGSIKVQAPGKNDPSIAVDPRSKRLVIEKEKDKLREKARREGLLLTEDEINAQVNNTFNNLVPVKKYLPDISQSVRYAISWPRAVAAFLYNPITGKGPFSLGEATDGDYFRWLGEFGLFGTFTFLAIFFAIGKHILQNMKKFSEDEKNVFYGFLFGVFGLLINAVYIDVFEASKLAYHVWLLAGLYVAFSSLSKEELAKDAVQETPKEVKVSKKNSK